MIMVIKQNPRGEDLIRYEATPLERTARAMVLRASWTSPRRDLGYTQFETGDQFIEYYSLDDWFNVFAIANAEGVRKGWYCNIAQPAVFLADRIEQRDLLLDVWIDPRGKILVLDEEEFERDLTLTDAQRQGALKGLQSLLDFIQTRRGPFVDLGPSAD